MWKQYSTPKLILIIVRETNRNTHTQSLITALCLLCNWGTPMTQTWRGLTPHSPTSLAHSLRSGDRRWSTSQHREFQKVCRHRYQSQCVVLDAKHTNCKFTVGFFLYFTKPGNPKLTDVDQTGENRWLAVIDYKSEWGCVVVGSLKGVASLLAVML